MKDEMDNIIVKPLFCFFLHFDIMIEDNINKIILNIKVNNDSPTNLYELSMLNDSLLHFVIIL